MTKSKRQYGLAALVLLLASTVVSADTGRSADASLDAASYQLQPGDVIEISVWKEKELTRQVLVRPDGGLSFPLAGDLMVAGLTPSAVQHELESRLTRFISDATVTVSVVQISGNQVFVVGKVNRPGGYKVEPSLDVMQALSLAGGATEFAGVDDIKILRRGAGGQQEVFSFNYSDVIRGRRLEQNIVLQSGDTLVVP